MGRTRPQVKKVIPANAPRKSIYSNTNKKGTTTVQERVRKPHRWKSGTVALREMRRYQKETRLLIPKAPLQRIIRDLAREHKDDVRFSKEALYEIHEYIEAALTKMFDKSNLLCLHSKRKTVSGKDFNMARKILDK